MSKINYSKMKRPTEVVTEPENNEEVADEVVVDQFTEPEVEVVRGKVIKCKQLRVRRLPNPKADVICTLDAEDKVVIDLDKSTFTFFKVTTSAGVEGYCMKQYIAVV